MPVERMATRAHLPATRSILEPTSLGAWIAEHFELPRPVECTLQRLGWNDSYLVRAAGRDDWILRVYGPARRSAAEIAYELDLIDHLKRRSVGACGAVPARDGRTRLELPAVEGMRDAVLFERAHGKVAVPTNVERADLLGAALGQLHAAADSFAARTERRPRELGSCLDAALAGLSELPYRSREVQDSVHSLASRVRARLAGLDAKALDFGPIHGDPFSNNAVLDASGRVRWYDFDECAPAHRAWDLSVPFWLSKTRSDASLFQRFVGAYRAQRPLEERELAALPWLLVASLIRTLVQIPRERGAILGREIAEQTVSARLEQLRGAAAWLVD